MTPFPIVTFFNEEVTDCVNKETIGAINEAVIDTMITGRNPPSCFFFLISFLIVSLAPSINRPAFYSDSAIIKISSVSSFATNRANTFPALTAPCSLILVHLSLLLILCFESFS